MEDPVQRATLPLGTYGGTRICLSYNVFFAAAIVVTAVLMARTQPASGDLPLAVTLGVAFWVSGWASQMAAHGLAAWSLGLSQERLTLGIFGVESQPRYWSAARTLVVSSVTVLAPLVMSCLYRLIEGGFQTPVISDAPGDQWTTPGLGFSSHDSLWRSAAWLCAAQSVFQLFPLPRSMGRQAFAALCYLSSGSLGIDARIGILRRCVLVIAIITMLGALSMLGLSNAAELNWWPLMMLASILLWISCYHHDLRLQLTGFNEAEVSPDVIRPSVLVRIRTGIRSNRNRKRVRKAMQQERREADDAQCLDEILRRLHADGPGSLSDKDRKILDRVSETLRKQDR